MAGLRLNIVKHALKAFRGDLRAVLCVDNDTAGQMFKKRLTRRISPLLAVHQMGFLKTGTNSLFAQKSTTDLYVACDQNNYVLDFELAAGNIHDSIIFPRIYERLIKKHTEIENVALDAGYKIPAIARQIINDGKTPIMPYKRPMTKKGFFRKHEYVYGEYHDCCICPNNAVLKYSATNRDGYREYKSNTAICANCSMIDKCTRSRNQENALKSKVY